MLEAGAPLRPARGRQRAELGAQLGPLAGLGGQLLLLAALSRTVGIGGAGWLVGLVSGLVLDVAIARALWRDPAARLGPAGWVTLTRATLVVGIAALTAASFERPEAVATLVTLAWVALALDFVDGWIARRTATESALGARLDGEVDAFLILVLSVEVAPSVGAWVLAIGLARYAFLAAGWGLPWLRAPLPQRDWRKTVTALQGIALVIAAGGFVPTTVSRILLAIALALLAESFGRDIWWLARHRHDASAQPAAARARRPAETAVLTLLALAVVWAVLVAPIRPWLLTPGSFVRLPLEGLVVVGLAIALPTRARRFVPWLDRTAARRPLPDQAPRSRLLHRLRPALQPGRGLELPHDRRRDGACHLRQQGRRSRGRGRRPARARGVRRPHAGREPADASGGPSPRPLAADCWHAHRLLGPFLGVRGRGLRGRDRLDERRAARGRRGPRRAGRLPRPGSVQGPDRPQGPLPQYAPHPAARGSSRQGRAARLRRELREAGGPGHVLLARASTPSSTPERSSSRPTDSPPAAAGSPRRRSAEAAGSRTPRCSPESGSTAPAAIPSWSPATA